LDVLPSAFAKLQNEKLIVAGTGTDLEKYKAAATNNVKFTGFLNRDELNIIMAKAKAVIVPSQWYETFGMVIIEAFSNAVPVIVGDIGNIGILVNDGVTGKKFKYDSADSLADMIKEYESMNQDALRMNARKCYEDYYSPEVNYNRLMKIYKAVR